jgi:hypothetical protein
LYNFFVFVGFEVLTAVLMKTSVFWSITPCIPSKVIDVSEEYVTSIFRVEDKPSKKPERRK